MLHSLMQVQKALKDYGFTGSNFAIDGINGKATSNALKKFQTANGLSADGKYGPLTEAKLFPSSVPARPADLDTGPSITPPATLTIDPHHTPPSIRWPLQKDVMAFYGSVGMNQGSLVLPFPMRIAWDLSVLVNKITLHKKVIESAGRAFEKIASSYNKAERADLGIDIFGGSLAVRKMRGGSTYSMHSWGIAIDFDPERNGLKTPFKQARLGQPDAVKFWEAWEAEGWVSLGRQSNFDTMHVQAARTR